jgi:ubiquinone/menaquinone biosynthesis C-methylase UbiE
MKLPVPQLLKDKFREKVIHWVLNSKEFETLNENVESNRVAISQLQELVKYYGSGIGLPSKKLQIRVVGGYFDDFISSGFRSVKDIVRELAKFSPEMLTGKAKFLDFGSGPGRVTLALNKSFPQWQMVGCDIDNETIEFAQSEYSSLGINFHTVDAFGKTAFSDGEFNVIFGSSVFTHLPEDLQHIWLAELSRIADKGAILLLSVENKKSRVILNKEQSETFDSKGFFFYEGWHTDGLPDFYRTTLHTHDYVHKVWSEYFEILHIEELGNINHQDLVVCRKR